jgi:two-component system KDP operon response regulator KdpE
VIDDEPMVRGQLRRSLSQHGYAVHEAEDGRSALAQLTSTNPDVIILDMSMPDLDGADVLARLRAMGSGVPVVLSSGYVDAAVTARLDPGTYQGQLGKPYTVAELIDAIESARGPG